VDIEVVEVVSRQLSPSTLDALISERQRQEMGSALFNSFVVATTKPFGLSPATFIRHLHLGWRQILQDCGVIEVANFEQRSALVVLRQLPAVCLASSAWIGALPAGMRVLYELINSRGTVTVASPGNHVELRFDW
jgi:hypothetical protein